MVGFGVVLVVVLETHVEEEGGIVPTTEDMASTTTTMTMTTTMDSVLLFLKIPDDTIEGDVEVAVAEIPTLLIFLLLPRGNGTLQFFLGCAATKTVMFLFANVFS